MTWGFTIAAKSKAKLAAKLDEMLIAQPHGMPAPLASAMKAQVELMTEPAPGTAIFIESTGHLDGSYGGAAQFRIYNATLIE